MRRADIRRETSETRVRLRLNLDGRGRFDVKTGLPFFDHMIEQVARHAALDLHLRADGDLDVDEHHLVEDVGLVFGQAVHQALGTRHGINRAGYFVMPMDDTLAVAAIDFSGRPFSVVALGVRAVRLSGFPAELVSDFFQAFAAAGRANVHLKVLYGRSSHHRVEAVFKAFARALRTACARDRRLRDVLPSTKGLL